MDAIEDRFNELAETQERTGDEEREYLHLNRLLNEMDGRNADGTTRKRQAA